MGIGDFDFELLRHFNFDVLLGFVFLGGIAFIDGDPVGNLRLVGETLVPWSLVL